MGERAAGQYLVIRLRQLFQNPQELEELDEMVFLIGQRVEIRIYSHDSGQRKRNPVVCRLEHLPDGVELVLRKDSISKEIRRELDGY